MWRCGGFETYTHGEAVAAGMIRVLRWQLAHGYGGEALLDRLTRLLPRLLEQRYEPGFEVIVVNEGGSVATSDVVSMLASQHRNLYLTYTPDGARSLSRKKLALMLGIKAAQNRVVVHTMATATITSPLWLASIMRHFSDPSVEVVLGKSMMRCRISQKARTCTVSRISCSIRCGRN